jgi:hypothetical protein
LSKRLLCDCTQGGLSITQTQARTKRKIAKHQAQFRLQANIQDIYERLKHARLENDRLRLAGLDFGYTGGRKNKKEEPTHPQAQIRVTLEKPPVTAFISPSMIQIDYFSERDFFDSLLLLNEALFDKALPGRNFPGLIAHLDIVSTLPSEAVDMKRVLILQENKIRILVDERNQINNLVVNLMENNDVQKFLKDYAELSRSTDEKLPVQPCKSRISLMLTGDHDQQIHGKTGPWGLRDRYDPRETT